jgi:hypothetical protein
MSHQKAEGRRRNAVAGFTMVELMISMVAFVFVIAAASQMLTGLLTQFKQQSKISETNTEGIIGLEILRHDLEHAGYGLPWVISGTAYLEASGAAICDAGTVNPSTYNDSIANPPRAIVSGNNNCTNNSDYLVIKAVNVAGNDPSRKSTRLISTSPYVRTWTPSSENLDPTIDRVIVIKGGTGAGLRELIQSGGTFYTTYNNVTNAPWPPSEPSEFRIVYGISESVPRMPFNRADYYISTTNVPVRCAGGTGVLEKATLDHSDGTLDPMPVLDCVADMQVFYRLDTNADGTIDNESDDISLLSAQQIREQTKEVKVYILAHEGQRDPNYTYPNNPLLYVDGAFGTVINFDFASEGIINWQNYRWKVYTISIHTENLGSS